MRKHHPSRAHTKRLRRTRTRRSTLRVVSPNSSRTAGREGERRIYRQNGRLKLSAPRKGSTALVERLLPLARKKLVTLQQDAPFIEAAKLLANKEANLVIICDRDGLIAGVVAKTDIVREICEFRGFGSKISISTAMTREIVSCRPRDFLVDVWSNMKSHGLKHIPIVDHDSRPIGLAIARDVLGLLIEDLEHEEQLLHDYVMCVGYR
ncbi:MAG: CBS domain-containing protein [Alphaproteobacteria bacterium]|nr:CBS domain-containing protein [Alphaproteobacteria bacterium]